jgi:nitrous oxidase accessory protein NosD
MTARSLKESRNVMTATAATRTRRTLATTAATVAGAAALAVTVSALAPPVSALAATQPLNCTAALATCGFPSAASTGPVKGTVLRAVPGQVSSGPGWSYNSASQQVNVTGAGAVLSGLSIPYTVNVTAANVTLSNDQITTNGYYGVSLRHAPGATISNTVISGTDGSTGEVGSAIIDIYADSTGLVIKNDNISWFRTGIQVTTGTITGNYIHDPGYIAGDHTNGILDVGTTQPLSITGNTILDPLNQTDAISLDATLDSQAIANKAIRGNLLGGGSYPIYAGNTRNATVSNITVTGNTFSQAYYAKSGLYGPAAYYSAAASGDTWSANTWDSTGQTVPSP